MPAPAGNRTPVGKPVAYSLYSVTCPKMYANSTWRCQAADEKCVKDFDRKI